MWMKSSKKTKREHISLPLVLFLRSQCEAWFCRCESDSRQARFAACKMKPIRLLCAVSRVVLLNVWSLQPPTERRQMYIKRIPLWVCAVPEGFISNKWPPTNSSEMYLRKDPRSALWCLIWSHLVPVCVRVRVFVMRGRCKEKIVQSWIFMVTCLPCCLVSHSWQCWHTGGRVT